jgi:UDP:flavonoid glycosyltransferase YjiC (YdhE family)
LPQIKIAKKYIEKGGKGIFFSHGGKFQHLAKEIGCKVVKLKNLSWKDALVGIDRVKTPLERQQFIAYNKKTIESLVKSEIEAFKEKGIDIIVSSFNPTCSISTKVLDIPLIVLISGTTTSVYYRSGFATFPDNYENIFTRILPVSFKNYIARWILLSNNLLVKDFNRVARKYNIKRFSTLNEILEGDHTLFCDDINLFGKKASKKFPINNFIGPVSLKLLENKEDSLDKDIKNHLKRPGKSILFTLGSAQSNIESPVNKLFIKILGLFSQTDYNVIVICGKIPITKLPKTSNNILIKKYVKSPEKLMKKIDLAIIHGGRGTVYNVAYSGKPSIGIPFFIEQQYNIDCLVRNGAGKKVSSKFFKSEKFLRTIKTIFDNYDMYLKNAKKLSKRLSKDIGEEKAVKRIIEIAKKEVKK